MLMSGRGRAILVLVVLVTGACSGSGNDVIATASPAATAAAKPPAGPTLTATRSPAATATSTRTAAATATTAAPAATATATATATAPRATATATATPTVTRTPSPSPVAGGPDGLFDTRVTHLEIPAVGIDLPVQGSHVIPNTSPAPPGCPAKPAGQETLTVPNHGIATPDNAFTGLENKAWIYGHSRWQNVPGVFFVLQDLDIGDVLFADGYDRGTGAAMTHQRFVVNGIYLTDTDSGGTLVTADSPDEIPSKPTVILQTSARESGANKQWLLDRDRVMAKATNLVPGNVDDPCKYLLLFVFAQGT